MAMRETGDALFVFESVALAHAQASLEDLTDGVRVRFVADLPARVASLREGVRKTADRFKNGSCPTHSGNAVEEHTDAPCPMLEGRQTESGAPCRHE
ncbi:MAG: hypothetical protein M5R36_06375 [Deltaproteobacteria bacterium]|nr:hypothetical protein [Deltaproteobacteria bacterium]